MLRDTLFDLDVGIVKPARFGWHGLPLIVDSFAGGGGASTGIEMALGRSPDIAINHNPVALAMHAANHPDTLHLSENIYHVDPLDYVAGQHIGLAWFSPDCKHFSKAKGGKPVERNIRDLAHIIPFWVDRIQKSGGKIDVIIMENVEEFATWGPLMRTERGEVPDPERRGETFQKWCRRLRRLGGKLEMKELRGFRYGAPTIRNRLFVIIRFDGRPIMWPEETHGEPDDAGVYFGQKLIWRTAAEIIDWSLPCPSIFDSVAEIKAKHGVSAKRPLADNTEARIARGFARYVLEADAPFLVNLTHGGRCEAVSEPFRTITGAHRGEKAVVVPHVMTMRNAGKPFNGADEPTHTITAGGAGLSLVSAFVSRQFGMGIGQPVTAPSATVTAGVNKSALVVPSLIRTDMTSAVKRNGIYGLDSPLRTVMTATSFALMAPHLMSLKGAARRDRAVTAPHPTVLAGGGHSAVIAPTLIQTGYGERAGQEPRALDIGRPLGTVVAGGVKHAVVIPSLVGCGGRAGQSRPRGGNAPLHTVTAKADTCIAAAFVAQHNNDSRRDGGVNPGRPMDAPLSTITASGAQQGAVAAYCAKYFGTGDGAEYGGPLHTVTTKDRFGHVQAALDAPPFTEAQADRARLVAAFLRKHGFWDDREFVTLTMGDATFVVVDIGMRMLTPRELFNAQGFPADYEIDRGPDGQAFTKSQQVSACGNSVCPPVAAALVAANCGHLRAAPEPVMMEAAE
ncbi:MAG: DNA cytosine methyltransferase [Martelella sp.]|uniref:DNA cytosine methyltransferase n=1 Tax=Martelella sp. TaxID=1969699 RepID=UPI003241DC75